MESTRQNVTTRLVHRRERTEIPWWRTATVCDFPGAFSDKDLRKAAKLLPAVAELGFDAVLIRPANPRVDVGMKSLPQFVQKAHDLGLKVLVRVFLSESESELGPEDAVPQLTLEHDAEELQHRAKAVLDTGADGVDLGLVNDETGSPDAAANARAFTEAVRGQLATVELAGEETILAAAIVSDSREATQYHLTEEWFHHLRDDTLVGAPWDAREIQERVRQVYGDRDPLGHTAAWRYSLPKWTDSPYARSSDAYGWAAGPKSCQKEMAMMLYAASLPGAIYVPFLHVGGAVTAKDPAEPGLKFSFGKGSKAQDQANIARKALHIRKNLGLGATTLAFLEGTQFCTRKTAVQLSGSVMVVLNTGTEDILVPVENRPLVTSRGLQMTTDGATIVRPNSCAWFQTPKLAPANPVAYH